MTDHGTDACRSHRNAGRFAARHRWLTPSFRSAALIAWLACASCKSQPQNNTAVGAYYGYDFVTAREALRREAYGPNDGQTILNNTRLGLAALADGDLREAERALGTSFEFLSTAGLNKDKTVAVFLDHEGVRIWKGEPFEQALTYHYVALTYALLGDWENVRAAAANALFRLTDFGKDQDHESLARKAADDEAYLDTGYTAVDTSFALGFLMQAVGSDLSGTSGAAEQFDAALRINPDLAPIVDRLRNRECDTLLIVDYGRGPIKQSYGEDQAFVHFVPFESTYGRLMVHVDDVAAAAANAVCDVNAMARDHRWNNLEDVRRAKSILGNTLLIGGAAATAYGADREHAETALVGIGAMALGLLTKAGARADTRYCEFMPQSIYVVPLLLERSGDMTIEIEGRPLTRVHLNNVVPGTTRSPRVLYLRLFGDAMADDLSWMTRRREYYSNDYTGVLTGPAGAPWILGGRDVSTPSRSTLTEYQRNGFLSQITPSELQRLYSEEGILIGSGMENREDLPRNPSYRHVLEGGCGLFTPHPHSMGYLRIMNSKHPAYEPRSELVWNAARAVRVLPDEPESDLLSGALEHKP